MDSEIGLEKYRYKKEGEPVRLYKFCSLDSAAKIIGSVNEATLFARKVDSFNDVFEMWGSVTDKQRQSIRDMILDYEFLKAVFLKDRTVNSFVAFAKRAELLSSWNSYLKPDRKNNLRPFRKKCFFNFENLSRFLTDKQLAKILKAKMEEAVRSAHLFDQLRKILQKAFYVTSFAKNCKSPHMWGTYADSSRGVCLQFDFQIPKDPFVGNVHYIDKPFDSMLDVAMSYAISNKICRDNEVEPPPYPRDVLETMSTHLFQKSKVWFDEEEVRFVIAEGLIQKSRSYSAKGDEYVLRLPRPTACYLGPYFSRNFDKQASNGYKEKRDAYDILKNSGIELIETRPSDTEFSIIRASDEDKVLL